MSVVRLPLRVVLNPDAKPPRAPDYRPAAGFLLDTQQPRLPSAQDKGYIRRPHMRSNKSK